MRSLYGMLASQAQKWIRAGNYITMTIFQIKFATMIMRYCTFSPQNPNNADIVFWIQRPIISSYHGYSLCTKLSVYCVCEFSGQCTVAILRGNMLSCC